jgi:hypothetical protein
MLTTPHGLVASGTRNPSTGAGAQSAWLRVGRPLAVAVAAFVLSAPSTTRAGSVPVPPAKVPGGLPMSPAPAAIGYTGQVTGGFNTVKKVGQNIQQTAGANAQTPPNYAFVNANHNATAVTTVNNGAAISIFSWGTAIAPSSASSVSWIPVPFTMQPPEVKFLIGKIVFTNGTIVLTTGAFGATLSLTRPGLVDDNTDPVQVTGLELPFTNWDTTNLGTGHAGAVKGLAGNNVVDAAGKLFDDNGDQIKDNLGNQVVVPGPSFYDTYWSTDYISFEPAGPFANFTDTNDAGTFENKSAVFAVYGKIVENPGLGPVADPQLEIIEVLLDSASMGNGYSGAEEEHQSGTFAWEDLGSGIPGINGIPLLMGTGTLEAGSPNQLELTQAKPSAPAILVFGLTELNAPLKGGILIPAPLLTLTLPTSPAGAFTLPFIMPPGLPPDFELFFQFWIPDAAATKLFAASNGLKGVTP